MASLSEQEYKAKYLKYKAKYKQAMELEQAQLQHQEGGVNERQKRIIWVETLLMHRNDNTKELTWDKKKITVNDALFKLHDMINKATFKLSELDLYKINNNNLGKINNNSREVIRFNDFKEMSKENLKKILKPPPPPPKPLKYFSTPSGYEEPLAQLKNKKQIKRAFIDLPHSDHTHFQFQLGNNNYYMMNATKDVAVQKPEALPRNALKDKTYDKLRTHLTRNTDLNDTDNVTYNKKIGPSKSVWHDYLPKDPKYLSNNAQYYKLPIHETNGNIEFLKYEITKLNGQDQNFYGMLTCLESNIVQQLTFIDEKRPYPKNIADTKSLYQTEKESSDDIFIAAIDKIKKDYETFNSYVNYDQLLHEDYTTLRELPIFKSDNPIEKSLTCKFVDTANIFTMWAFYLYILLQKCNCIDTELKVNNMPFSEYFTGRCNVFMNVLYFLELIATTSDGTINLKEAKRTNSHILAYMFSYLINLQLNEGLITPNPSMIEKFDTDLINKVANLKNKYVFIEAPSYEKNTSLEYKFKKFGSDNFGTINVTGKHENNDSKNLAYFTDTDADTNVKHRFALYHGNSNPQTTILLNDLENIIKTIQSNDKLILFADTNWTPAKVKKIDFSESAYNSKNMTTTEAILEILVDHIKNNTNVKNIDAYCGNFIISKERPKIGFANEQINKMGKKMDQDGMVLMFINYNNPQIKFENHADLYKYSYTDSV